MGKKVKKKARSGQKDKRVPSAPPKTVSEKAVLSSTEATNDKAIVLKDKRNCPHLDKGVDLDKLSAKLGSSAPLTCEDCREGVDDRRGKSGRSKQVKKKGGGDSKAESKAIWICLECGHFSCGGVGLPTRPQTHAIRHSKQHRHPLAVQFDNPQLRWCFTCSTLIPAEKSGDGAEQIDVLPKIGKMIKAWSSQGPAADVEDIWFGSGSVLTEVKSENSAAVCSDGKGGYSVRGLVNLGNTCFFNSVLQNLLALDRLRDYYGRLEGSIGPLTAALKKLVGEISPDSGLRTVINPKPFFGSICAKAPQFRGFQQQDSHELLRCLLDGLSTEELNVRKRIKSSEEDKNAGPMFVDAIFGGQIASTVTCLECGHTSIVYEPFLDLSLPVPTKKPPSKKAQSVTRAKKSKLPPRKSGRTRPKLLRDASSLPSQRSLDNPGNEKSSSQVQIGTPNMEQKVVSSGDSALWLSTDASAAVDDKSLTFHNSTLQHLEANQGMENVTHTPTPSDDSTWLDFLGDDVVSNMDTAAPQTNDQYQGSDLENVIHTLTPSDDLTWLNFLGDDAVSNMYTAAPQMNDPYQGSADQSTLQNDLLDNPLECSGENISSCSEAASYKDNVANLDHYGKQKLADFNEVAAQTNGTVNTIKNDIALENGPESCSHTRLGDLGLGVGSSGNFSEEETPLLIQDSTVLLLPYKDDTSVTSAVPKTEGEMPSPTVGYEQDSVDFDGFGDMFNEPEAPESSSNKPASSDNISEANQVVASVFVGNSSESEPDEVDNTDAPVSVESCLAYFTKAELLSKDEHAWQCENCSKILHEERTRLRKKLLNPSSRNHKNGDSDTSGLLSKSRSSYSERRLVDNGNLKKETPISDGSCMKHEKGVNGVVNCTLESGVEAVVNPVASPVEGKNSVEVAPVDPTQSSTGDEAYRQLNNNVKDLDGCNADGPSDTERPDSNAEDGEHLTVTKGGESEGSENEKTNCRLVKVERDATKRILISKVPPILTIHLKRFSQDARGRLSKLNGHVAFDQTIDLKPYMDPRYNFIFIQIYQHRCGCSFVVLVILKSGLVLLIC